MRPYPKEVDFRDAEDLEYDQPVALPYELRNEMTWMDFSHPVNPLGAPREIVSAMHTALVDGELEFSPDRRGHTFRDALARQLGISSRCICVGSSATQMIRVAATAFKPAVVGISVPCPPEYAMAVQNAGHRYVELANSISFAPVDAYTARKQVKAFEGAILANPMYPTSRLLSRDTLINYLETCSWVIVDESNIELSFGGESVVPLIADYPNLIVVRAPSVTFGMPGVPLGYLVAHPDTIAQIRRFYDGSDVSMFAEVLAKPIVDQVAYIERTHDFLDKEIPWMQCMLNLVPGIGIHPAEGNFVLCELRTGDGLRLNVTCTEELIIRLQLAGFLVRPLKGTAGLPHDEFFCVSVKRREENQRLLDAMRSIISGTE